MTAQAGWYVDPRDSTQYRYWDGERWSQSTQPIPSENTGLAIGDTATSTLATGGTAEPIGAGAFGAAGTATEADSAGGDAPADLMWTAGFGDDSTSSRSGAEMFSPDQSAGTVGTSPWQPGESTTPAAPIPPSPPVPSTDQAVAQPSAFTPSAPQSPASGGPMFIRDTGSDPAFTPAAPAAPAAPGAASDEATAGRGSKLDQYTMPAGQVPDDHPTASKRTSRRKRADAEDAGAVAAGAAAGATLAGGVDGPPKRRRKSSADASTPAPAKSSGSLPPGAKPVKSGQTSRLPLLLGVLGVVVVGAAAFLFLRGGDDEGGDVATDTPETTAAPAATTAAPTATTAAEPTAPVSTTPAVDPATTAALEQAFGAEVTRACDSIKADPGQLTENVIQFDPQWEALGRTYEDLQRAVNECSQPARDEALRRVAEAAGGG